ncbi:helix-turn-helix domain-containing protein [Natronospira bacteriovora]|uniref:helix-turn-helix domain-containing protein n=1 Tax=Natronospira bacteriovora TaxID=3069753 RepID=UPI0035B55780
MNSLDQIFKSLPYGEPVRVTDMVDRTGLAVTTVRRALRQLSRGGGSRRTT